MSKKYHSPLRYPGGKGKLLRFVRDLIVCNDLVGESYSEPYAGGASVALGLLIEDFVSEIHVNDVDVGIYCFWQATLDQTDELLKKIWDTPLNVEEWRKQFHVQRNMEKHCPLEIGFSTFFLNRTNRSGVINAGVIGGLDQSGPYKIDARFNKENLAKRIKTIACHKSHIKIYNQDAIKFLTETLPKNEANGLIFLDPPYYAKGKNLYTSFYRHEDHEKVARAIKKSQHKHWILTYDNVEEIDKIYDLKNKTTYSLRYSVNHQSRDGSELLIYSEDVKLPYHPNKSRFQL